MEKAYQIMICMASFVDALLVGSTEKRRLLITGAFVATLTSGEAGYQGMLPINQLSFGSIDCIDFEKRKPTEKAKKISRKTLLHKFATQMQLKDTLHEGNALRKRTQADPTTICLLEGVNDLGEILVIFFIPSSPLLLDTYFDFGVRQTTGASFMADSRKERERKREA